MANGNFFKKKNEIFWQFFLKKCQVFGNFLTVKWEFSGGSGTVYSDIVILSLIEIMNLHKVYKMF